MKSLKIAIIFASFYLMLSGTMAIRPSIWASTLVDHSLYGELLMKYVKQGEVDYQGLKGEEGKLDRYLRVLEKTDSRTLSRDEQFAFYVNAYNAWTLKLILSGYPGVKSIKELGSFLKSPWKKKLCRIDGDLLSLDDIEHKILRARFKDPRVHFAVNCASKGCPPLRPEPYQGSILNRQLDEMTTAFISDPASNRLEGRVLYASKIFDWFSEDFDDDVVEFFLKYAKGSLKKRLETNRDGIRVKYLDYDWSLNGK
ncbi:DUF547 domain-containing protein [Thermodesulfobacteriota bacterium]